MGVQVDEAGNQDVVFQYHALRRIETAMGLARWAQPGDDPSFMNSHGMVFERHVGVDRGDPAGLDQQVNLWIQECHSWGNVGCFNVGRVLKLQPAKFSS